jgi:hypothetical protein
MTNQKMDPSRAEDLKQTLRALARQRQDADLGNPANTWTLWSRPTSRALPDILPATDYKYEFMEGAASLAELFAHVEREKSYMLDQFDGALILEAKGADEFVIREYFCWQG